MRRSNAREMHLLSSCESSTSSAQLDVEADGPLPPPETLFSARKSFRARVLPFAFFFLPSENGSSSVVRKNRVVSPT